MSKLRLTISMSLDGYVAGPDQSLENPLGVGGMRLHEWAFELGSWRAPHGLEGGEVNESSAVVEQGLANVGACTASSRGGAWPRRPPHTCSSFALKPGS
jgi:hypothetical protein